MLRIVNLFGPRDLRKNLNPRPLQQKLLEEDWSHRARMMRGFSRVGGSPSAGTDNKDYGILGPILRSPLFGKAFQDQPPGPFGCLLAFLIAVHA